MNQLNTLPDILHARRNIYDKGITIIQNQTNEIFISYQSLYQKSLLRLHALHSIGITPGDKLILQINDLEEFIISFWAGLLGGFILVPLAVPPRAADEHFRNIVEIIKHLKNPFILTDTDVLFHIRKFINSPKKEKDDCQDRKDFVQHIEDKTFFIHQLRYQCYTTDAGQDHITEY